MNATRNNHLIGKFLYLLLFVNFISGCIISPSDVKKAAPNSTSANTGTLSTFVISSTTTATAGAGFNLIVTAKDANNNTLTSYSGTIHFTSSDSNSPVLPSDYTFVTGDNGSRSFPVTLKTAGVQSITVVDTATSSITGSQNGIMVASSTADYLAIIAGDNQSAAISSTLSINPKVRVYDIYGNPVAGKVLTFAPSAGASVGASTVTSDASGYAETTMTLGAVPGANTLTVAGQTTLPGVPSSVSFSGTGVTSGANTIEVSSGNSQSVVAGNLLTSNLVVIVKDSNNNPVPGITVDWSTTAGTLGAANSTTDANGLASNSLNPGTVAGTKTITATIQGTASSTTFTAAVTPAGVSATTSTIAALPLSLSAGSTATVTMTVKDQYGNVIPNQTASFVSTGTTNTIIQLVSVTDSNGQVTGTISSTLAEAKTISFGLPVALSGVNSALTFNPESVSSFALSGVASTVTAGTTSSISVTAKDAYSNTVSSYTGTIAFTSSDSQASHPASYTFSSGDNGAKTISGLVLKTAGTQSVTATDTVTSSITGSQSGITVGAAAADHLVMIEGDAQQELPNVNLAINPKVKVVDAYGNGIEGISLTFTPDTKASVGQTSLVTDASGMASTTMRVLYSGINNDLGVGSVTVTSSAALAGTPTSLTFTSKLKPNQVILSVGDNQTYVAGEAAGLKFFIRTKYILANIPNEIIDWTSTAGGTFSANSGTTGASDGRLEVTFFPPNQEGTYTQDAKAQLRGTAFNFKFSYTVIAGVATNITIVSGNNQSAGPGSSLAQPFTISALDQYGNKNGIKVDWIALDGSISKLVSATTSTGETSNSSFLTPGAAGNYQVIAKAKGGSASASFEVTVTGSCAVSPSGSPITPRIAVSRLSGVAPLSVFFDATGTTSPTFTTRPMHDLEYRWDFGDASDGTWNYGSRSGQSDRNVAIAPIAAHVYRTPGTYTVSMSVTDGTNTAVNACTQIVVEDPEIIFAGANTYCFSGSGTFAGCPAGAVQITISDYATAINTYKATGRRLLFNRGETFTSSLPAQVTVTGPGIIGAYGAGNRPVFQINYVSSTDMLLLSSTGTPGLKDWRIMDIEFSGEGLVGVNNGNLSQERGVAMNGGMDQVTLVNLNIHNLHNPIHLNASILSPSQVAAGHTLWDQFTVIDSTTSNVSGCSAALSFYGSGKRLAFMGNSFDNSSGGEHTVRIQATQKAVVNNNLFQGQGTCTGGKHAFTVRSTDLTNPAAIGEEAIDSYHVVVNDNKFIGASGSDMTVGIAPECAYNPNATPKCLSHLNNIILERNYFKSSGGSASGTQVAINISATSELTFRNNILNLDGGRARGGVQISGSLNDAHTIRIFSNTIYSKEVDNDFIAVIIKQATYGVTNITMKNNISYSPLDTQKWTVDDVLAVVTATGNTCNTNHCQSSGTLDPIFSSSAPVNPIDWTPSAAGYAAGNGVMAPVWSDFFGNPRSNSIFDIGAIIPQ